VSALLLRPAKARELLVLAHGAGRNESPIYGEAGGAMAGVGVATLRYQFPYMEARRRAPDATAVLTATVVAAVRAAAEAAPVCRCVAGASPWRANDSHGRGTGSTGCVRGLVFFGFPLHPPNQRERNDGHLAKVAMPMLFLQGTRVRSPISSCCGPVCEDGLAGDVARH